MTNMTLKDFIALAAGSLFFGLVLIFILLAWTSREGIDLSRNLWLLALPTVLALIFNIISIEVYSRIKRRK